MTTRSNRGIRARSRGTAGLCLIGDDAEAGVAVGRTLTSYPSIRTDLRNAGAHFIDEEVVVDGNLISSRSPSRTVLI